MVMASARLFPDKFCRLLNALSDGSNGIFRPIIAGLS